MPLDAQHKGPRKGELWDGAEVEGPDRGAPEGALEDKSPESPLLALGTYLYKKEMYGPRTSIPCARHMAHMPQGNTKESQL